MLAAGGTADVTTQGSQPRALPTGRRGQSAVVHPVARLCLATTGLLAVALLPLYPLLGLHIEWRTAPPFLGGSLVLGALWVYHRWYPGPAREWAVAELLGAVFALALFTEVMSPAQYLAVATRRPFIDPLLASADAMFGIHVGVWTAWTRTHPWLLLWLKTAYFSLLPQFILTPVFVALWRRNREELWEFMFHFHFCGVVTVLSLAAFPAACAFTYLGFESALDQARFLAHFNGVREGTMTLIRFNDLEGLISMPSFHVAGALMCTWAVRRQWQVLVPVALLNTSLIAATVLTGAHYAVDIAGSTALFVSSIAVYRLWMARYGSGPAGGNAFPSAAQTVQGRPN